MYGRHDQVQICVSLLSHMGYQTMETITEIRWAILPYLVYSSGLVPFNFHSFHPLNDILWGHHCCEDGGFIMGYVNKMKPTFVIV